jgi:hypothetical protein
MKVALSRCTEVERKSSESGEAIGGSNATGKKIEFARSIRSVKTGSLMPKEGTLVSVTENLGRTLLLVEFARGQREYVFENEVEFEQDHSSSSNEECYL